MKASMKIKKVIGMILAIAILVGVGITGMAQTNKRSANIKSKGIIDFENGTAVIDATDFTYLADEIDLLENTYKTETVKALGNIGTYFKLDGSYTHNQEESTVTSNDAHILPYSSIMDGITNSQSIPSDRTYTGTLPGSDTETSGNISGANAENLSLGTAAWVDGELIVGTGADNNSYYSQGHSKGYAEGVLDGQNQTGNIVFEQHYHSSECYETCYIIHEFEYLGTFDGTIHAIDTVTHTNCGIPTVKNKSYPISCDTFRTIHQYTICGYSEGQVISATIKFD